MERLLAGRKRKENIAKREKKISIRSMNRRTRYWSNSTSAISFSEAQIQVHPLNFMG
jgi:hypothetical protein